MAVDNTFHGSPCRRAGHTLRYKANGGCVACLHRPEMQEYRARWGADNPGNLSAARTRWKRKNKPHVSAYKALWVDKNRSHVNAYNRTRTAVQLQRTPVWADHEWIEHAYFVAADMTAKMGESFHVDHELPLQGKKISGLHVYENLQILPAKQNLLKKNHFEPQTLTT